MKRARVTSARARPADARPLLALCHVATVASVEAGARPIPSGHSSKRVLVVSSVEAGRRGTLAMSAPLASPLVAGSAALLYGGTGVALAFINKAVISVYGFQVR